MGRGDGFDIVVVGAGAAGCVIARRLSESGDRSLTRFAVRGAAADFDAWAASGNPGWTFDGLAIVDASIIPEPPSGFPHIITIMIAEHLSEKLAALL